MSDPRWPAAEGWVKMRQNMNGIEIHYLLNTETEEVDDFKFIKPSGFAGPIGGSLQSRLPIQGLSGSCLQRRAERRIPLANATSSEFWSFRLCIGDPAGSFQAGDC